jgi:hypothetical protein
MPKNTAALASRASRSRTVEGVPRTTLYRKVIVENSTKNPTMNG